MTNALTTPSRWGSRKLWISLIVIALQVVLVGLYLWALMTAPEKVSTIDGIVAAVAAVAATVTGVIYTTTEGKIDLQALPGQLEPLAAQSLELAELAMKMREALERFLAEVKGAAPAADLPADNTRDGVAGG